MEIGDFIRSKMKEHYNDRTIRRVLPDTAKHLEFTNKADILSASEREPIEIPYDKVSITPTNTTLPTRDTQPNEVPGYFNIGPREFKIEELDQYNKDQLVEIIKTLHLNNYNLRAAVKIDDRENKELEKENDALKKEIAEIRRLPSNDALINTIDLLKRRVAELEKQLGQQQTTTKEGTKQPQDDWLLRK
jgi:hypothetical protein